MADSRSLLRQIMIRLDEMQVALRDVCAEVKRIQDVVEEQRGDGTEEESETKSSTSVDDILAPTPRDVCPSPFVLDSGIYSNPRQPTFSSQSQSSSSSCSDSGQHGLPLYLPSAQLMPSHALSRQGESILETILRTETLQPSKLPAQRSSSGDTWCSNAIRIDEEGIANEEKHGEEIDEEEESRKGSSSSSSSGRKRPTATVPTERKAPSDWHLRTCKSSPCHSHLTPPPTKIIASSEGECASAQLLSTTSNARPAELYVPEIRVTTDKGLQYSDGRVEVIRTVIPPQRAQFSEESKGGGNSWSVEGSVFSAHSPKAFKEEINQSKAPESVEEKAVRSFLNGLLDRVVGQQAKTESERGARTAIDTVLNQLIDGAARNENSIEGFCLI